MLGLSLRDPDLVECTVLWGVLKGLQAARQWALDASDEGAGGAVRSGIVSLLRRAKVPDAVTTAVGRVCAGGFVFFYALYHWTTVCVKHRRAPLLSRYTWTMLTLLRPLQVLFRLATAPLRVVPDLFIVGEVRCGTTTTANYLARFPSSSTPFCLWRVPFADNKESFYLVGHVLGLIHPLFYRMVFPTVFTKLWQNHVTGQGFFTYDACAQYATARWVPHYLHRVNPNAKVLYCLREPVSQNVSWYNFEKQSDAAFDSMGAGAAYVPGREPATTMREAWDGSLSPAVAQKYAGSEALVGRAFLPLWAATWPRGQTYALSQMGRYSDNVARYLQYFPREQMLFLNQKTDLSEGGRRATLEALRSMLPPRAAQSVTDTLIEGWCSGNVMVANANAVQCPTSKDPALLAEMAAYYKPHNAKLEELLGRELGW